jgi:hypothetical protein
VSGGFICFDDVWIDKEGIWQGKGKGKTAIPFLLSSGYRIIVYNNNSLLLQNMNGIEENKINFLIKKADIINLKKQITINRLKKAPKKKLNKFILNK